MKDPSGVRHNLTTLAWKPNLLCSLVWERHLTLTDSLLFWERQPCAGSQTNRILPTAIVFLKHPSPSEMLCQLKSLPSTRTLGDVAKWLILILPEDRFSFLSLAQSPWEQILSKCPHYLSMLRAGGFLWVSSEKQIWPYEPMCGLW